VMEWEGERVREREGRRAKERKRTSERERLKECDANQQILIEKIRVYVTPPLPHTHCNILQRTATHCNTLQHTVTHCSTSSLSSSSFFQSIIMTRVVFKFQCNTLQLQHTATYCKTLQNTAKHCKTLQHTATHCNRNLHSPPSIVGKFQDPISKILYTQVLLSPRKTFISVSGLECGNCI